MNKNVIELYNKALAVVLDENGITAEQMFGCNSETCVEARTSLIVGLNRLGVSDKDIAELTHKMRRCSVCKIRNRFNDRTASWTVKMCIDHLNSLKNS